ncbi:M23 family metallopeptidase [Ectobacillus sp. JY-23]|uniref:M23 family metallopeptidase n=1 Tax=Ectobacillus sp. JY-23 TaxID=2933872 RepID=UPI001FF3F741|nr:M23 family metallopeptidase [Ectobacillus sp. JY-23]UOY93121.1 M23 family metallopeptidase [Ectobacillus sp. JY-23]
MRRICVQILMVVMLFSLVSGQVYAIDYTIVFGNTTTGAGTINLGNPHSSIFTVTSKFNQPRDTGPGTTNPHNGVDLGSSYGEPVYAIWNGWVLSASMANHEMFMYLDLNNDGLKNDNAHVKFDHLSNIFVTSGYVTKGTKVAATGDEGGAFAPHLHFGVRKDLNADGVSDVWVKNEPYYRTVAAWDYGKMLDFISYSTFTNNVASVYAYAHSEVGKQSINFGHVIFFHRKVGASTWVASTGAKNGDQFTYNFTGVYPAGTQIQWMVRGVRSNIVGTDYYWAFSPPKFKQPDFDPNATAYKFDYYTNIIQ